MYDPPRVSVPVLSLTPSRCWASPHFNTSTAEIIYRMGKSFSRPATARTALARTRSLGPTSPTTRERTTPMPSAQTRGSATAPLARYAGFMRYYRCFCCCIYDASAAVYMILLLRRWWRRRWWRRRLWLYHSMHSGFAKSTDCMHDTHRS